MSPTVSYAHLILCLCPFFGDAVAVAGARCPLRQARASSIDSMSSVTGFEVPEEAIAAQAAPGLEDQEVKLEAPKQHVEEQDPIVEGSPTLHKVPSVTFLREEYVVVHTEEPPREGRYANFPKSFSNPGVSLDASMHSVVESIAGSVHENVQRADGWSKTYLAKWGGSATKAPHPPFRAPGFRHHALSLFQAAISITFLGYMDALLTDKDLVLMVGSFGATAVLVYSAIDSPLAQPRNVIYGHFFSALVGVTMQKLIGKWQPPVAAGLAVGTAIVVMERTHCVHPPGGATALFAVIGSQRIHDLGYLFAFFPALIGAMIMVAIAVLFNNMEDVRSYPKAWRFPEVDWAFQGIASLFTMCCRRRTPPPTPSHAAHNHV